MSEISGNIQDSLAYEAEKLNLKGGEIRWTGRFLFTENDKMKVLDRLHREVSRQNCRAFEKIKGKIIAASRRPEPIETRILQYRPISKSSTVPDLFAKIYRLFETKVVFANLEYTQNIVFKAVDDTRMIIIEIDDVDGYQQPLTHHAEL